MYDNKKLEALMKQHSGNVKEFSRAAGLPYTSLRSAIDPNRHIERMGVSMFFTIAHTLGMTADELMEEITID